MLSVLKRLLLLALLVAVLAGAWGAWWWQKPLTLRLPAGQKVLDLAVPAGSSGAAAAQAVVDAGVDTPAWLLQWAWRVAGDARRIKAGSYEMGAGATPASVLDMLVRGEQALRQVTLVEGWTFRQVRAALDVHAGVRHDSMGLSDADLMRLLGADTLMPEGLFFPDTYLFGKGESDLAILARAHRTMQKRLQSAWQQRDPEVPLASPYEALILASIVEKETGQASERALIAGVFVNRLRAGMKLQTDPTVIYGLGVKFDGKLRKRDLMRDGLFNTYTRAGLPPHPIAMPGQASLLAVLSPARTDALYFVARGDGTSQFSRSLEEHNRAVAKYQKAGR